MIFATTIALADLETIFKIVKFAWGGFGAAFGPVILMALYSKRTTWQSALAGMLCGTAVMLIWYFIGMNAYMYEILPGFMANFVIINLVNKVIAQNDETIIGEYDKMLEIINNK